MTTIAMREPLTISNIDMMKNLFSAALAENGDDVDFDLHEIADCDSSGVQLLIATHRTAVANKRNISFINYSEATTRAFTTVGIADVAAFFSLEQ